MGVRRKHPNSLGRPGWNDQMSRRRRLPLGQGLPGGGVGKALGLGGVGAGAGHRMRLIVWADHDPQALMCWARGNGVAGVCVEHFLLHAPLIATLLDGGLGVATGTVNDPELARRVAALGGEAITTDAPERLAAPPAHQLARSATMMRG